MKDGGTAAISRIHSDSTHNQQPTDGIPADPTPENPVRRDTPREARTDGEPNRTVPRHWQDRRAEWLNVLTHGGMAVLVLLLCAEQLIMMLRGHRTNTGEWIFLFFLLVLFTTSSLYHGLPAASRWKRLFNRLDHMAIYLTIAGTYTPIALSIIGGPLGRIIVILQWLLALSGLVFKLCVFNRGRLAEILSVVLYVVMGWMIVFFLPFLTVQLPPLFLILIASGGLFYSIGLVFYAGSKRYSHVVWHLFVNSGALCHLLAIFFVQ